MDARTQGFPAEHFQEHHCWIAFFTQCILVPSISQKTHMHPAGPMINLTRPPSTAPSSSFDHFEACRGQHVLRTDGLAFAFALITEPWVHTSSLLSFLGPPFVGTDYCVSGTSYKACRVADALTQTSSHHNLALVRIGLIFMLEDFSCFQHINFKNYLFTCCLIYATL